jgi:formylglycine-generating enzyme required for sulfatase activity
MEKANCYCAMKIVFVDIVAYSRRPSYTQLAVIHAFMKSIEAALSETARRYVDYTQKLDVHIRRDVVVLPSGDGAAISFPFEGVPDMHLFFACELLKYVDAMNKEVGCDTFDQQGWCECHGSFLLRCGISDGNVILYKDLNGNYNIAGDTMNMASRVMALADASQIFLTAEAHRQITDLTPRMASRFRVYRQARIKHDLRIDVFQYIDGSHQGVDVSPRGDLGIAGDKPETADHLLLVASIPEKSDPNTANRSHEQPPDGTLTRIQLKGLWNRMVTIPNGEFLIGNENTGRVVMEIASILIDKYPATQEDYEEVMGRNPSRFVGAHRPVENISWLDAVTFCNRLSELSGLQPAYVMGKETTVDLGANGYRLPTEAEWEYCCRAGDHADRYGQIGDIAWYAGNAEGETKEVGGKRPNGFGLHDMLGNVWEWCNDWYQRRYPTERQVCYLGPTTGLERVLRGGSWRDIPDCVRSSFRHRSSVLTRESTHGLRLVLPLK